MFKRWMSFAMICIMAIGMTGCFGGGNNRMGERINIEIEIADMGVITAELYPDMAPETVANFLRLIDEDFFNGLIFHRVVPGFVIQGGGQDADGMPRNTDSITGEFANNGFSRNTLEHTRGVLSMARIPTDPNSASSQFFICVSDERVRGLNDDFAGFGMVTEGMEIVDRIVALPTTAGDRPENPPVITTIRRAE